MLLRLAATVAALAACIVLVGCGGGGDGGGDGTTAATPAEEETTPAEEEGAETSGPPETPVTATLDQSYRVVGGQNEDVDESELPVPAGSVEARWYRSGDRYVAVYVGVPADAEGLCPGNSIQVGADFESISNSPASEGACEGAPALASEEVQTCGDLLVYVSEIPADASGTLYASIERYEGDTITGVTGSTSTAEAPEVELADLGC